MDIKRGGGLEEWPISGGKKNFNTTNLAISRLSLLRVSAFLRLGNRSSEIVEEGL